MLKLCKITACSDGTLGIHLSRAPWDPYPWISGIQEGSNAFVAGIRPGDTVLSLNGNDVLGQKISELANVIRTCWDNGATHISFLVWRSNLEPSAINQHSLQKFATCLQNIAQLLECPICLEVVNPPGWQCCNGHVLCNSCRGRTTKCPVCRVTLGPRGRCLLSDKLFTLLAETFPSDVKKNDKNNICTNIKPKTITSTLSNDIKGIKGTKHINNIKVDIKPTGTKKISSLNCLPFHCPTGKLSCSYQEGSLPIYNMQNQWDILTHIRKVHQLSVIQYYGTYGECFHINNINKSISCISIISNTMLYRTSLSIQEIPIIPEKLERSLSKTSLIHEQYNNNSDIELFFIVKIPLNDETINNNRTDNHKGYAIFIWYCGKQDNEKNFEAVIECKCLGIKWIGNVHSLMKEWKIIQQRNEFLKCEENNLMDFDVTIILK